jgi:hypothetical protein
MDRVFQIAAVGLISLAAYFFWAGSTDAAFASAVLGCVSFFLSIRVQMKERNRIREEQSTHDETGHTD